MDVAPRRFGIAYEAEDGLRQRGRVRLTFDRHNAARRIARIPDHGRGMPALI
jgi:hypothetical protein